MRSIPPALGFSALVAVALISGPRSVQADFSLEFSTPAYTGTSPTSTPPWATASFESIDPDTVRLTIDSSLDVASEFLTEFYFNFDPALDLTALDIEFVSGVEAGSIDQDEDGINVPGGLSADIVIDYPNQPASRLNGTKQSVYDLNYSGAGTFNAESFSFLTTGNRAFLAVFHVQGIPTGAGSGHVAGTPVNVVPEPSTLALSGIAAMAGLGIASRRLRRRG
ncbi:PEP-CTERM sorting domain-containing protein [Tautonia plasticadhaerens]|uniref:Ice-binding protein C-terminal domain-containing protein n=1 Tax=Tautonia plasticadhaerens TaxID=2527974 RepID=A0A518H362_9BACT|nr:PEP-CTERM sorting domain-containing protein [Tautonia plasticadhaerens]QDV35272.1 hypothetical protein ElP_31750 [Tautonia plasticadhaerens]